MFRKIFIVLVYINFFSLFASSMLLGGDGLNGKKVDGHFFLGNHGKYTEVSEAIYTYSRIHGISLFIMVGIVLIMHLIDRETKSRPPR